MTESASRLFSWLNTWREERRVGRLEAIFIAELAGAPMRACTEIECVAGRGLAGDRYVTDQGHWTQTDACQVTLITREDLLRGARRSDRDVSRGQHRRNLVITGIPLPAMRNRELRIGAVRFAFHRLRPPCAYLDRIEGQGTARAIGKGAGIGLRVLDDGLIRVGDRVDVQAEPMTQRVSRGPSG